MIETQQSARVRAGIDQVWDYVRDIARWAEIMPGYQSCEVIDDHASRWTLKVGVGRLIRTVKVQVQVNEWAGPGRVEFSYRLAGDPVAGGGTYTATAIGALETEITLHVRVVGSGPMAPMWEAMGKPLLPQFAAAFAEQLRDAIELAVGAGQRAASPKVPIWRQWLRRIWRKLTC